MLRIELMAGFNSNDAKDDLFPFADDFTYLEDTSKVFELFGHLSSGKFAGHDLLIKWSGSNFEYDRKSDGSLTWTDGNIDRQQFFIDGKAIIEVQFDPPTRDEDYVHTFNYRADRGITFIGNYYANYLEGGKGADKIYGYKGNDYILGHGGADSLYGEIGEDTLDGGAGVDRLVGGEQGDTYYIQKDDVIVEGKRGGIDTAILSSSYVLGDFVENLTLTGSRDLHGIGSSRDNVIRGNAGDNLLSGRDGDDSLYGGNGNDRLYGGDGRDYLSGGKGADVFVFQMKTGYRSYFNAEISAITSGVDQIDLSRIDADVHKAGNQAFSVIPILAFTGVAGELFISNTLIYGDVDGDTQVDFSIYVHRQSDLLAGDFIL